MKMMDGGKWLWWSIMLMLLLTPSSAVELEDQIELKDELGHLLSFRTVTFDLRNLNPTTLARGYSNFLTKLRNQVQAPTKSCGVQSTRRTPVRGQEYVLVKLQIENKKWITLGIDVTNLYVWAYQDNVKYRNSKGQMKYRASFLAHDGTPASTAARNNLFRNAERRTTTYSGHYTQLQRAANQTRRDMALDFNTLRAAIQNVHGKPEGQLNVRNAEARLFLIAIQMVAEATRFKFMEQGIIRGDRTPAFKNKMVDFQNNWDSISQAIHRAEAARPNKCTVFNPPLNINGLRPPRVSDVTKDMGMLLFNKATPRVEYWSSILDLIDM